LRIIVSRDSLFEVKVNKKHCQQCFDSLKNSLPPASLFNGQNASNTVLKTKGFCASLLNKKINTNNKNKIGDNHE